MTTKVPIDRKSIAAFCRRHRIRKLALFGSVLRDDFGPASDVDVLVEFEPEQSPGMLALATMEMELSDLLGRTVDLRTPQDLSPWFRDDVLGSAEVLYAA